jgi:two-component system, NarL family, sensor histidine kinase UhpB
MSATPETSETSPVRILHLEDSRVDHSLVKFALQRSKMASELTLIDSLDEFRREIATEDYDIVLADYHLPGFTGLDAWEVAREVRPELPFVILSGAIGETAAVEAMHRGVSDYLLKDDMQRLAHVIQRALEISHSRQEKVRADAELAESRRRLAELAEHLQASIEQERADISREIHDDIGGSLAAVKLDLAWVGRHATGENMQQHIATAMEMLQHALGASQRIMLNLRPPILDQGLVAAVRGYACDGAPVQRSDRCATRTPAGGLPHGAGSADQCVQACQRPCRRDRPERPRGRADPGSERRRPGHDA